MEKLAYTIKEAAVITSISKSKLFELIQSGDLPKVKLGAKTLIRREDLQALLDRNVQ